MVHLHVLHNGSEPLLGLPRSLATSAVACNNTRTLPLWSISMFCTMEVSPCWAFLAALAVAASDCASSAAAEAAPDAAFEASDQDSESCLRSFPVFMTSCKLNACSPEKLPSPPPCRCICCCWSGMRSRRALLALAACERSEEEEEAEEAKAEELPPLAPASE